MPSKRKRIGFLPRAEIQNIIDQICEQNKLSQSKVTGILVEEGLSSKGFLNNSINNKSYQLSSNNTDLSLISDDSINNQKRNEIDKLTLDEINIKDEVHMINDYIEFKFFKNIMKQNKKFG